MPHPDEKTDDQPLAVLKLSEYELQVFETIATHAIDQGVIRHELLAVADGVLRKARRGRADLALARRRKAARDASRPAEPDA